MYRFFLAVLSVLVCSAGSSTLAAERPYLRDDSGPGGPARWLRLWPIYATAWYGTEGTINLHMSLTRYGSYTSVSWYIVNDTARDLHSAAIADREYECSNGEVITAKGNWWTDPLKGRRVADPFPRAWVRHPGNPDIILHKKSPAQPKGVSACYRRPPEGRL